MRLSDTFYAMGTNVDLLVEAQQPLVDALLSVRLLFAEQEAIFSRFRPASLLSRLNGGEPVEHPGLAAACRLALEAHEFTSGHFNPMVLPALRDAGYDRTFDEVAGGRLAGHAAPDPRECLAIAGDRVQLRHSQIDLGGIVKGWTVDLAIELLGDRVEAAMVNAGGDLRTLGGEDEQPGWWAEIEGPGGGIAWKGRVDGALVTSTRLRRRWRTDDGQEVHHLINPRTGRPAASRAAQVSVWGPATWTAEAWAKAVLIGGDEIKRNAVAAGHLVLALDAEGRALPGGIHGDHPSG